MRIVQLTDLHLGTRFGDARWQALDRGLAGLEARVGSCDRLVLTGDLAARGQRAVYGELRTRLAGWLDRLRLVPGNHDDARALGQVFAERVAPDAPAACFLEVLGGVQLVGLDSSRPRRVSGRLGAGQRAWLAQALATGVPSLLFVHHPPIAVGAWWLDKDRPRDRTALAELVRGRRVLGLFCGHVHQPFEGRLADVPVWTTPSTAYQFAPRALLPRRTREAPAAGRLIEVRDGVLRTSLLRWP